MAYFDPFEILIIMEWNVMFDHVSRGCKVGCGQHCIVFGKADLYMTLRVLNHGGQWHVLDCALNMKGIKFERDVSTFVSLMY